MPKYRVNEKIYNLPEEKVESFLVKYPNAELVTEKVDFPTSTVEDAGAVQQPMTASQAGATELPSVDTSLELPKAREVDENIEKEVIDIYKNRFKQLELTDFGTPNYDDKESIAKFRDDSLNDFINKNKIVNEKIIPLAKKEIMTDFLAFEKSVKNKYNFDDPKNISQEKIDSYVNEVGNYYNRLLNSKIQANPEFKTLINDFNTVMDQQGETDLKRFVKGKDWEIGLKLADIAEESPFLSENLVALATKAYTGLRGVFNELNKSGQYGGIQLTTEKIKALDKNKELAKKQGWTNETRGYWIKDDSNEKGSYLFRPKFQGALKSRDGVSYRDNTDLIEQRKPAGAIEGTWGEFQDQANKWISSRDEKNRKNLLKTQEEDFALNAYDEDEFNKLLEGKDVFKNVFSLVGEQLPQMGLAVLTLGASSGFQIGSSIYTEGIDNKAREIFNLPDGTEVSISQKREVMKDEDFMDNLSAKATSGGFLAGQLEKFGAGKAFKNFVKGGAKSMLRGGMTNFLKRAGANLVNNTTSAATEAITEVLQEVIQASAAGGELKKEQLFEAGGTGFVVSLATGVGGNVKNQTLAEVKSTNRIIAGKLNPNSSKAFFDSKIQEIDNIAKNENNPKTIEELKEKRNSIIEARDANEKIPSNFSTSTKEKIFDLVLEKQSIEKEIKNKDPELVVDQVNRVKEINNELNSLAKLEKTTKQVSKIVKGIKSINIEVAENQEQADKIAKDKNLQKKASTEQGYILQDPKTGEQTIVINEEIAKKDFAVNVAAHELLHGVLFKTIVDSPDTAVNLGNALKSELNKIDANQIKDSKFKERLELYKQDPDAIVGEETLTLFSDAIATGDLVFEENLFTRIGDTIRRVLQKAGLTGIKFNNGRDVYNFIKDYNKSIEKGKLTKAQTKAVSKGIEGELVAPKVETVDEKIVKESRSEEASQEVQKIYDEQGVAGAFDILEKFKPITNKLVERRRDAPNFDRQLLTDEIETGKRGIFDLIKEYKPDSGVPLAAYINKFLPARAIEASKRVLGEEFTDDVTEAKGVAAEEVAVSVKEEPTRKISPKKLKKYTGVIASNLGVSNSEVSNVIDKAIETDLKAKPIKTFGESRNIGENLAKTLGKAFGLNPEVFTKKTRNIQKKELDGLRNLRQFLDNNAAKDFSLLPDAYAGPSTIEGKSTFIPNNILNALYRKNNKGKWEKDPTKTVQDYKNLLGKIDGSVYRAAEAQTIKGLAAMSFRNLIVEKAAETAEPKARVDIKAGAKFSKAQLLNVTQARDINSVAKILNIPKITVNDTNRVQKQKQMEEAIVASNIPSWMFEGSKFANFARRKVDGVYVDLPAKGGLYYGSKDPAYKKALALAKQNDTDSGIKPPKRVNINKAFTKEGQQQGQDNLRALEFFGNKLADAVAKGEMPIEIASLFVSSGYQATSGIIKVAAPFRYLSKNFKYGTIPKQMKGEKFREEHNPPASVIGATLIYGIATNNIADIMPDIKKNYYQTKLSKLDDQKLDEAKLDATLPVGTTIADNPAIRFIEAGIDLNSIINYKTGETMAEELGVSLNPSDINLDNIAEQNKILKDLILNRGEYKNPQTYLNNFVKLSSKTRASKINNNKTPLNVKFSRNVTNQEALDNLGNIDKALSVARNADAPVKKIRVFDFDDTLATTKSNVLYTMPDGKTGSLTATEFAKRAGEMEAQGAEWDFSEFSKVMKGAKGPLLDVAKFINDAKGERDVFVLTARPADAAGPIKEFLDSMGLNIPLENITGLGDGTAEAKARWMVDKAAEGYNDFYFADDASKNVKAVKQALDVLDVKSKVQQAYVKFSNADKLSKDFNNIIEGATGIASEKIYGSAKAQVAGASRGKVFRGIAYSAQDFVGLLYETLGKGKVGDAQMAWYKQNLLNPYARAMNDLSSARLAMMNDYRALKKQLGIVPKNLRKKLPGEPWTREQAVRVYVWNKQGTEVPGISKNDLRDLTKYVAGDAELQVFADQLIAIQKGDMYPDPGESWVSGSISTDMLRGLNTIKRAKYLEQWQANVDAIFSKENKNKLEAAYGIKYVKALENSLERMKTGRNRSFSDDGLTGRFTDWLQGSVGAIMFFNTRSAVLQTLSAVNFVNFTDNNPYAAAKAFANQKQYWKDFTTLMNSDFLKERRSGLRMNVNEADIADMAKQEGPRGVINKLLQLGFAPTQIADSFAIASGGATFYRNRIKTYTKQGLDQAQAEEKAFQDFRENAEESQQSSRPDKISMQQAGPLGRLILAFANTPAQYARLTDKAIRDLKNGRGDAKTNISKIIYYTTVQNIIFNAVQQALFAMAFGDEEPEDEKKQEKYIGIANGMADSLLRGTGIAGSVVSVGKNAVIRIINESKKKRPKYEKVGYELTKISPPVSAKLSRINQAARAYEWNKEEMMTKGFSLDNPAFLAGGNVVSAFTNIPLDRVVKKINNVTKATESDMELWERVALFAGWQDWELGIKDESKSIKKKKTKSKKKRSEGITFDEF